MTTDDVEQRVQAVIADVFGLEPDEVTRETSIETVEGWDSVQHLTLVLALEDEFEVQLDDEETTAARSVPAITGIIRERRGLLDPR